MVEMMYEKLRVYYKTVRTLERLMGQITINETLETILNLRATLMQEYLSSSSLTAIIMRSQIMPPKLIEQMALWKKSSLRKSWSRPSHYHRLMRLQTWALKNGAHHFEAECYSVPRVNFEKKVWATQNSRNFCNLKNTKKCFFLNFLKYWFQCYRQSWMDFFFESLHLWTEISFKMGEMRLFGRFLNTVEFLVTFKDFGC